MVSARFFTEYYLHSGCHQVRNRFEKFCIFLAHLSRRLIGELIGYSWSGVSPSGVSPSVVVHNAQRSSSPKPLGQSKPLLYGSSLVRGTEVCSRHLGHMTKMAATPIYGKNPSKIFSGTGGQISTKLGM